MNLESILQQVKKSDPFTLHPDKHVSIEAKLVKELYITPNFIDICTKRDSRFIVFSATGATGKSALAKHMAYEYNGIYWNLAEILLGENTFYGTLAGALGYDNVSSYLTKLNSGKAMLIIDAFDEAEVISGRVAIDFLLNDLIKATENSHTPSIILLARTDVSRYITTFLDAKGASFSHYEIGFFSEQNSKEFIRQNLQRNGYTISQAIDDCINQQFVLIAKILKERAIIDSFIGYAPVLEALTLAYDEDRNTVRLLNLLIDGAASAQVIIAILNNLMIREQEKVVGALRNRWASKYPDFNCWDCLYTPIEQAVYCICITLFGALDLSLYTNKQIPSHLYDDYKAAIKAFVPNHPFIKSSFSHDVQAAEFTGPAFRDYVLSMIFAREEFNMLAVEFFTSQQSLSHCPSQLLFDFYIYFTNNRIASNMFPYLLDSFRARETQDSNTALNIETQGEKTIAQFIVGNTDYEVETQVFSLEVFLFEGKFCFRNIINSYISIDEKVVVGDKKNEVRVYNSTLVCKQIIWSTPSVCIEAIAPKCTTLVSREPISTLDGQYVRYNVTADKNGLFVSAPNISVIPSLKTYTFDYCDSDESSLIKFSHCISKIFGCLRKHSKDTPARDKDFIDNIIIGSSNYSRRVLAFLVAKKLLFIDPAEPFLYKLDVEKSREYGISWGQLIRGEDCDMQAIFDIFKTFQTA